MPQSQVTFESTGHTVDPDVFTASAEYDRRFSGPAGEFFLDTQRDAVLKLLKGCPNDGPGRPLKILELGGGHLQMTEHLLAAGHSVTVHSSRGEGLEKLSRAPWNTKVDTLVLTLDQLPGYSKTFDATIALRLIPHVLDTKAILAQMERLSSRAIIFDYAASRGFNALSPLLFQMKRHLEKNTRPYFCHSPENIECMLRELQFSRIENVPQFFFPMGLHRKLGSAGASRSLEGAARALSLTRFFGSPVVTGAYR